MSTVWNVSYERQSVKYDGEYFEFGAGVQKNISNEAAVNHILFKLGDRGLVRIPFGAGDEEIEQLRIDGLINYQQWLVKVVGYFREMNMNARARNLGQIMPDRKTRMQIANLKKVTSELERVGMSADEMLKDLIPDQKKQETAASEIDKMLGTGEVEANKAVVDAVNSGG